MLFLTTNFVTVVKTTNYLTAPKLNHSINSNQAMSSGLAPQ